jgi:predicted AAA+ superfamily ATPase
MSYIVRAMEETYLRASREFPVVLLTGPRQCGKTTMLEHLLNVEGRGRSTVSLDDLNERNLAKTDPAQFFQLHPPPVFIDEVQHAPELFTYIKIQADCDKRAGDFWLSGSQIFRLMRGVQESMAGRVALLHLLPLSQSEILGRPTTIFETDATQLAERSRGEVYADTTEVYRRIFQGGMPALLSGQYTDRATVYSSYVRSYIERDVKDLSGSIDALRFLEFLTATAALTSQMVNYRTLAEHSGIDPKTAKAWLGILETLGIVFYLRPYSNNILQRTVSTPKLYFHDTAFVCHLVRWSDPGTLMNGAMSGALLENFVVAEILKSHWNSGSDPLLYYYRDKNAKEIDLVMQQNGRLHPIEIKRTATPDARLTRVFGVLDRSPIPRGTGAVICTAERFGAIDSYNLIVPVGMI